MKLPVPPRNESGQVVPHDHNGIHANDRIIRRISRQSVVFDPKINADRISTKAYQGSSEGNRSMSVDIEKLIVADKLDPRVYVTSPQFIGSVWFTAGMLRSNSLKVGFDPLTENPYHGGVWGGFTDAQRRHLMRSAEWFVPLNDVQLSDR